MQRKDDQNMGQPIQVISLFPDEAVVSGVHQIANALNKKRGYATSISIYDTETVLEAVYLVVKYAQDNLEGEPSGNTES